MLDEPEHAVSLVPTRPATVYLHWDTATMTTPEDRIAAMGLQLPDPIKLAPGMKLPFSFINVRGNRALISGHPRQSAEGAINGPFATLGADMTTQEGYDAARDIALSALANLKAEIGELSRRKDDRGRFHGRSGCGPRAVPWVVCVLRRDARHRMSSGGLGSREGAWVGDALHAKIERRRLQLDEG